MCGISCCSAPSLDLYQFAAGAIGLDHFAADSAGVADDTHALDAAPATRRPATGGKTSAAAKASAPAPPAAGPAGPESKMSEAQLKTLHAVRAGRTKVGGFRAPTLTPRGAKTMAVAPPASVTRATHSADDVVLPPPSTAAAEADKLRALSEPHRGTPYQSLAILFAFVHGYLAKVPVSRVFEYEAELTEWLAQLPAPKPWSTDFHRGTVADEYVTGLDLTCGPPLSTPCPSKGWAWDPEQARAAAADPRGAHLQAPLLAAALHTPLPAAFTTAPTDLRRVLLGRRVWPVLGSPEFDELPPVWQAMHKAVAAFTDDFAKDKA